MASPTVHLNLLQRNRPQYLVAWSMAGLLAATVLLLALLGRGEWQRYAQASARRDATQQQLRQTQARLDTLNQQQARSADALALRAQVEALRPQAIVAQALLQALGSSDGSRSATFTRALAALVSVREPGVWLTGIGVADAGQKLEIQGTSASGAGVLEFARRVNERLAPLAMRLDTLEMQPLAAGAPGADGERVGVTFRLH